MFKRYLKYFYSPTVLHKFFDYIQGDGSKNFAEFVGVMFGASLFSGWAKSVGKEQSNIINDSAQSLGTMIVVLFVIMFIVLLCEIIIRLPGLLILNPWGTLTYCLPGTSFIKENPILNIPLFLAFWTIVSMFALNYFDMLQPVLEVLAHGFVAVVEFLLHVIFRR